MTWLLATPAGRAVLAAIVGLIAVGTAYWTGRSDGARLCAAAALEERLAAARTDIAVARRAAADAHDAMDRMTEAREADLATLDRYDALLRGRAPCELGPDDVRMLDELTRRPGAAPGP